MDAPPADSAVRQQQQTTDQTTHKHQAFNGWAISRSPLASGDAGVATAAAAAPAADDVRTVSLEVGEGAGEAAAEVSFAFAVEAEGTSFDLLIYDWV